LTLAMGKKLIAFYIFKDVIANQIIKNN